MSTLNAGNFSSKLKHAVFGPQNERLEYLMDSYFKLSPEGRSGVIAGGIAISVCAVLGTIGLYLAALSNLQSKLDFAFEATNKLREAHSAFGSSNQRFKDLDERLSNASQGLTLISVLEQKAKELQVTTSGFPPQVPLTDLPATNPLADKYQTAKVEFRASNISLKKIIEFVIAIESTPHRLRVSSLKIKGLYQNKLFFDSTLEVEATQNKVK
jgi:hypothetical protein